MSTFLTTVRSENRCKMTPLILILVYFLVAVHGAAHPAPTPPARLDERQAGVATVWSPVIVGTTVSCAFRR